MPAAPPPEPLEGLTLEQYAGITVALADGFPLPAILANEGLAPDAWPRAESAWRARVARDGAGGPVFTRFCEKRSLAEDWLTRSVKPIDTELPAWMSFLRAWTAHPAPFDLLAAAGLGMNDLARLQRGWARRMAGDRSLREQAVKLAGKGAGPLPVIRAQPGALKPFPWSRGTAPEAPALAAASPADGLGAASILDMSLYPYIAAKALIAEQPAEKERIIQRLGLPDFAAADAAWQARFQGDPALARDYRQLFEHERSRLRSVAKRGASAPAGSVQVAVAPPPKPLPVAEPARSPQLFAATSLDVKSPIGPALPFDSNARGAFAAPRPPVVRPPAEFASTLPLTDAQAGVVGTGTVGVSDCAAALQRPPGVPELTVEQYASLYADLERDPEHAPATLSRYRLSPAVHEALVAYWQARLAADPVLNMAFARAYATYFAWVKANPGV